MSEIDEVRLAQVLDGSNPALVIVTSGHFRMLSEWTDSDARLALAPQPIRNVDGVSHYVMLEDDYLALSEAQVPEKQRFFLELGDKKHAHAKAHFWPDSRSMTVLKGSIMAREEAQVDFDSYHRVREKLKNDGVVDRQSGEFLRHWNAPNPSTAGSVLLGYRIDGYRSGWRAASGDNVSRPPRIADIFGDAE